MDAAPITRGRRARFAMGWGLLGAVLLTASCGSDTTAPTGADSPDGQLLAARTGALRIAVEGIPTGGAAAIAVTGPQGFSTVVTGTTTLAGVNTGSYTVTARFVVINGATYEAAPTTQSASVQQGRTREVAVRYKRVIPTTGQLAVSVTGLPTGASAAITVTGPKRYSQAITATRTLEQLAPGTYTVTARTVTVTGVVHTPTPASRTVTIKAGETTESPVVYAGPVPTTGNFAVLISGLPSGVNAAVSVSGPNGFIRSLTGTTVLQGVAPAVYGIAAAEVIAGGIRYVPSPLSQVETVHAGQTDSAGVKYSNAGAVTGRLTITVTGLPSPGAAAVTIAGPNSFTRTITGTATVEGIVPGTYTIAAAPVTQGGATYLATPATQEVAITANTVATRSVTYAVPAPTVGRMTVTVTGLPTGASGLVAIAGPNGYARTATGTTTIDSLPPGSYAVAAQEVTVAGVRQIPTPASQMITITAGTTTPANVTYAPAAPTVGQLEVTVSGLPMGTPAVVAVAGPNGYTRSLTGTAKLEALAPGSYAITAAAVTVGATRYDATPASQVVTITAGQTATASTVYAAAAPIVGQLTVTVTGLPSETSAAIAVTGPNGFTRSLTTTTTLESLTPGTYGITAASVTVGTTRYDATAVPQSVSVVAGATASVAVSYAAAAPAVGRATVTIVGLPSGVDALVTIAGPNGFSRTATGTTTLEALAPGTYTITGSPVSASGATYEATPVSQAITVVAGKTTTETVHYAVVAPTVGQLTVTITGLPSGVNGVVAVAGPNGFTRALTVTTTVEALAPGTYAISGGAVTTGGQTYEATPATQVVTIVAGSTANAAVAYAVPAPVFGELAITVNGLPAQVPAAITLTNPNGSTRPITATTALDDLAPGTYTITAASVTEGGVTYAPTPTTQTAAVTVTTVTTKTVTYAAVAPITGNLTVNISGLPLGAAAVVQVQGPNSFSRALTATTSLTALTPGTYTISAGNVTASGTEYTSSPTTQSVAVVGGSSTTRTVTYAAAPPVQASVTVDTTVRFQRMVGWEAVAQAGQAEASFPGYKAELMDLAANDLGINRIRVELASGAENPVDYYAQFRAGLITSQQFNATRYAWVNDNADPGSINASGYHFTKMDEAIDAVVVPLRAKMAARGEALYVSVNYVSFGNSTAQQSPDEYAELLLAAFQHMQSRYGFVPNAVEVILEPDNNTIRTGTGIGQLIAATGARLAAAGFTPEFVAPSVMNMGNAVPYLNQIVAVPGALTYLREVAYHRYQGVSDANLAGIQSRAAQFGLRTAMLEHIGSGVEDLYKDLTVANVSSWQQYTLAYPTNDNGAQYFYISGGRPVMGTLTYGLRQYFRYVRSGAVRVGATSAHSAVRPVAFVNPGSSMALVLHIAGPGTYTVRGLRPGTYLVEMTNDAGVRTTLPSVSATGTGLVSVSPTQAGVLTLYRAP